MREVADKLIKNRALTKQEYIKLLNGGGAQELEYLRKNAELTRQKHFGRDVYIRGLIEFTNYCKNDCLYCGIRKSNKNADRYRLSQSDIMDCCRRGYGLGFRTFVLQGGEDAFFTDEKITDIVSEIKKTYPDCAVTLSIGEKSRESYQKYFNAGADRYLLRHETANCRHYSRLHPKELSFENRMRCLKDLKDIGFQTGCGFMVESPFQTIENIAEDLLFLQEFKPHMVGIGPFIPHRDTPFCNKPAGSVQLTLRLLAIIRLMLPNVLLPSTTALGTVSPNGREMGILWGANVVMPNLSPVNAREKYTLYNNKICTGYEAAEYRAELEKRMESIGCRVVTSRGDFPFAGA